jgi:hypothetical protein
MSDLTEIEVIDRLRTSLRECIQCAANLAVTSRKGPEYNKLREHLHLVEGAARQLAVFRQDARWYNVAALMAQCHQKAGGWLRGWKDPRNGQRHHFNIGEKNRLFLMLEANLKAVDKAAELLRTQKTGRVGVILPNTPNMGRRIGTPVAGFNVSPGGVILP